MKKNKVSTIIPTVNAAAELDLTLASIKKNSDLDHQIIVVIDPDLKTGKISPDILKVCSSHDVLEIINDENLGPYGSWNKGGSLATSDWLIFATDDQYFAPHWDTALIEAWKPKTFVAGKLVEPGVLPVYSGNIEKDFGDSPSNFKENKFLDWVGLQDERGVENGGFFIPLLQKKSDFIRLHGYPTTSDFGTSRATSNDVLYVSRALKKGYKHITAKSSYSYHFQASSWKKKSLNPKIAAIILTHNSSKTLKAALNSIKWVDKIIIVDSGSTDDTLNIAKNYNPTIFKRNLESFADQRNYALEKSKYYDWVLMLDSDEEIESGLESELRSFTKDIYLDGVYIPRKNYIFNKWIRHSDWYPDNRLVFFRTSAVSYQSRVHEVAELSRADSNTTIASHHIIHHNYDTIDQFLQKNLITYPRLYASNLNDKNIKFKPGDLLREPIKEFMRRYFLSEGYRDGIHGLILALLMASQSLATYAYLWELQGKPDRFSSEDSKIVWDSLGTELKEFKFWLLSMKVDTSSGINKLASRLKRKVHKKLTRI